MASVTVNSYDLGDIVRLEAAFLVGTTPTNPTTTTVKVKDPAGVVTDLTAQLTTPTTGTKRLDYPIATSGEYWYRFTGTGTAEASEEGRFYARARQVV